MQQQQEQAGLTKAPPEVCRRSRYPPNFRQLDTTREQERKSSGQSWSTCRAGRKSCRQEIEAPLSVRAEVECAELLWDDGPAAEVSWCTQVRGVEEGVSEELPAASDAAAETAAVDSVVWSGRR